VRSVSEAVERILDVGGKVILEPLRCRLVASLSPNDLNTGTDQLQGLVTIRCWTDGRYFSAGTPAENLGTIGLGPNSVLIGHSVRFCDFSCHEPAARQLEDVGVCSECGHDTTDE
jgi:hypothetical protein